MNVLLIQLDGKMPNLALMKIARYHVNKGDKVFLNEGFAEKIYISAIFSWNGTRAESNARMFHNHFNVDVQVGGSGVSLTKDLPPTIEHLMPYYDLWGVDYSMGFTSRGCIRNCPFCIVPTKEGQIREHAPISEFLDPRHRKIILLDNNFLASPNWKNKLLFIRDNMLQVNFNQGLDIRLIDHINAAYLADSSYYDWKFKERRLHFAFDFLSMESDVRRGVEILESVGIRRAHLMFYMLCGYSTTLKEDMQRFRILNELGVDPFVMKYEAPSRAKKRDDRNLNAFARWVNKRIYRSKSCKTFEEYTRKEVPEYAG